MPTAVGSHGNGRIEPHRGAGLVGLALLLPLLMPLLMGLLPGPSAGAADAPPTVNFGDAGAFPNPSGAAPQATGITATPDGKGYWLFTSTGGVFTYGDAPFFGSLAGRTLSAPIIGMAATPDGKGYWLVGADGGIFAQGDAPFFGSLAGRALNAPIVGMAATPDGKGYWLVGADGGIFALGDATFYRDPPAQPPNAPIVAMAATPDGKGYWLVSTTGAIFPEGDAKSYGSPAGMKLDSPIVGLAATPDGRGYWLVGADGGVFAYGDATFLGSLPSRHLTPTAEGIATSAAGSGYWILSSITPVPTPTSPSNSSPTSPGTTTTPTTTLPTKTMPSSLPFTGPVGPTPPTAAATVTAPSPALSSALEKYACLVSESTTLRRLLTYTSPKRMTEGVAQDVEAFLTSVGTSTSPPKVGGPTVVKPISTTCNVDAYLKGTGFDVSLLNPGSAQQDFYATTSLEWEWSATATKRGPLELYLTIVSDYTGNGPSELGVPISRHFTIDVHSIGATRASPAQSVWHDLNDPFFLTLLIPVGGGCYHLMRRRRKKAAASAPSGGGSATGAS